MEDVIKTAVVDALSIIGLEPVEFVVEHPTDITHGDWACNVALVAASRVGQVPRIIAEQLCAALVDQVEYIDRIEVAGPGFLNFYLTRNFFTTELIRARDLDKSWGMNNTWSGKKVIVEYTDPNPFKEFHIGHLFTNAVGESLARLFMMAGAEVKRVCYQGDIGLHVAHALWGMQKLGMQIGNDVAARDLGRAYACGAAAYKKNETAKAEIIALNKVIYDRSDDTVNALYDVGRKISLDYFETIYALVGTTFDWYFFESDAAAHGKRLVLDHPEVFVLSDSAYVFRGEEYGLHTRVFLNQAGLPTYEAKELALAKMKEEAFGGYDYSVISTAKEINEYFRVLLKAMDIIYPDLAGKTEHIGHGMVRLTTGKMSSRTGDIIAATDFIADVAASVRAKIVSTGVDEPNDTLCDDVAVAAIKYETLKGSILQDSVFDKDKALSFEGDSGPYLQYTYARIDSVIEKAASIGVALNIETAPEIPYVVEKILPRFPEVVVVALAERAPHKVTGYLIELASAFNTFYAHEKIADPDDIFAPYKVAVSDAVRITLKNGLWILGITAPERL